MRLLFRSFSRSFVGDCRQSTRKANLKMFNVKDEHEQLFNEMIKKPGILFLKDVFTKNGFGIRIAGGAVRDLLCKKVPDDIDLATTAVPDKMISMLGQYENVRLITTRAGEKHGTIIARIDNEAQYEITTLRIDKLTDGRHAEVEFIEDWKLDASRRDLTFNSLFLDFDGTIYDYFNGIEHLKNKRVLFVGDPVERMEEDFLRILRYFRFYIRYGNLVDHDKEVLNAIEKCKEGLYQISGPRIWTELKKILSYKNSISILDLVFNQLKLGIYMGFNSNCKSIDKVREVESNLNKFNEQIEADVDRNELTKLNYLSVICALLDDEDELKSLRQRLSLSNLELYTAQSILKYKDDVDFDFNKARKAIILAPKPEKDVTKFWLLEVFKSRGDAQSYMKLKNCPIPEFPRISLKIKDRVEKSSQVGIYLNKLRLKWLDSDCNLTENELLNEFELLLADKNADVKDKSSDDKSANVKVDKNVKGNASKKLKK